MQCIKTNVIGCCLILLFTNIVNAQTSYTPLGHKEYQLLDRLDIKTGLPELSASFLKPINTRLAVQAVEQLDSLQKNKNRVLANLSTTDLYNIQQYLLSHKEYVQNSKNLSAKKGLMNVIEVNKPNFYLAANPAIQYRHTVESKSNTNPFLMSAGIEARSLIAKKVAINIYATGNRERLPGFVDSFSRKFRAIPGFSNFNYYDANTVQYYDVRASAQWTLAKRIDMQVGYDRNFIGNGYRSLLLSDFSGNTAFFKINTRLGKFTLQNLYMQLTPQFGLNSNTSKNKYLRINTLSYDVTRWLNIGIFDAVVFGRKNQFELNYILPFTFLRSMEQQSGSPDNAVLGLNAKANILHRVQVYGQLMVDEFLLREVRANSGWWANKFGYQIGAKYIDAFNIKNLDLQAEVNRVRPFTYTHFDSISNYSNNSLALAHPLGASFNEIMFGFTYQPNKKLYLQSKLFHYYQGLDTAGKNMGNNILLDYNTRPFDYNWRVGIGNKVTCTLLQANASFEVEENLFIDAGILIRNFSQQFGNNRNTTLFNIGFRWNITNRFYEF